MITALRHKLLTTQIVSIEISILRAILHNNKTICMQMEYIYLSRNTFEH